MNRLFLSTVAVALLSIAGAQAQNPYLPLWEHVPDGEPHVFDDPDRPGHQRVYVAGSHDTYATEYCGNDVRIWSAPVEDLTQWRDEGPMFTWFADGRWDTMYAPDIVETSDRATGRKTYWLYPHSRGWQRVGTVCRSDRPTGPFTPVNLSADGRACLDGSPIDFDPAAIVEPVTDRRDPDFERGFRAYAYWGFMHSSAAELDPQTMWSVRAGKEVHSPFIPSGTHKGTVAEEGSYADLYAGERPEDFMFFEASSIRRVGNKYVFIYSGFSGPEYGMSSSNSTLRYAYADTPLGPWRAGGVLVDSRGIVPDAEGQHLTATNAGHNTHGSIEQIGDQWYVFYHRPPRGFGYARQGMVAPIRVEWDKKPVARGGAVRISGYDAETRDHVWTARAADGKCYRGAEVTSEGFQIFGLPPYAYYSAGIACYMSGPGSNEWLRDNYDVWSNHMDLAGIADGGVVGFKYFGFGGLKTSAKGLPPFAGTAAGDGTQLCLRLTPRTEAAFRVRVFLDGPVANATWKGRQIAVVEVAANTPKEARTCCVAVPDVEGLNGKHAIYLVAEAADASQAATASAAPLLDLHGIGFVRKGETPEVPQVPQVTIETDGRRLAMPTAPVFASRENGYTDVTHYQLYAPLAEGSTLRATASDPSVVVETSPIVAGRATVRATYRGQTKTFLIN